MIQMLGVMENLWKCENLDLRMTRYQASKNFKKNQQYNNIYTEMRCM